MDNEQARKLFHGLLDEAMDNLQEGEHLAAQFTQRLLDWEQDWRENIHREKEIEA